MEVQKTEQTQKTRGGVENNEAEVRQLIDKYVKAFSSANIDEILSCYSPDVVAYDIMPPLQYVGRDAYRKSWEMGASMMQGPWIYESHDLKVVADSNVAYSHCLARIGGTTKEGKQESGWVRHTICYRKQNGQWLICHEQLSVPVEMESGKALMNLSPEQTH